MTIRCLSFLLLVNIQSSSPLFAQQPLDYFQQRVDYQIKAELDDVNSRIDGSIKIKYENKSSTAIDTIWFHLWPNAYSNRNTPLCKQMLIDNNSSLYFAEQKELGRIYGCKFTSDGVVLNTYTSGSNAEVVGVILQNPLASGGTIFLETPFQVDIPNARFSRLGHDDLSYNLTQWYPKPAVYDRNGWHCMPYLNRGEFYSEFGDFEVELTVPSNYIVAASGELLTESEKALLQELDRKTREQLENWSNNQGNTAYNLPTASSRKTVKYALKNAHDFAWFTSKYYQVLLDTVMLSSGKRVATSAFFSPQRNDLWKDCLTYSESGLNFLSNVIGDYPYESFAVVDGRISAGGGMEYPGITILNTPSSASDLERVLVHELGHNWFYGALASNEREHPWMDEGLNSYYEYRYMNESSKSRETNNVNGFSKFAAKALNVGSLNADSINDLALLLASFDNADQPISTRSEDFSELNYGVIAYIKTAMAFEFLFDYLGPERASKCIKEYYLDWAFRHPSPQDLKFSFEKSAGEDLGWFFDDYINTSRPHHLRVNSKVKDQPGILIERKSGPTLPLLIKFSDGSNKWIVPFENDTVLLSHSFGIGFSINEDYRIVTKNKNRPFNTRGNEKCLNPKIRLFPSLNNTFGKDEMFILPAIGWNAYDGFMAGATLSNKDLIPTPFEFSLTPLYSSEFQNLAGLGSISLRNYPISGIFSEVGIQLSGKRFGYDLYENNTQTPLAITKPLSYSQWNSIVAFGFRKPEAWSSINKRLELQLLGIYSQTPVFSILDGNVKRTFETIDRYHGSIRYEILDTRIIDPYHFQISLENGDRYMKIFSEFNYRFSYKKPKKGLDVRFFAGGFIDNQSPYNVNFRMSSWNGSNDYLFEEMYLGRNQTTGLWSKQMLVRDGGFISPTPLGQTNKWIAALHMSTDNPTPVPIRFFFNLGTFDGITDLFSDIDDPVMYEGGVTLSLIKDIVEIHMPLFYSEGIKRTFDTNNVKFAERIRFVLDLSQLSFESFRKRVINSIK